MIDCFSAGPSPLLAASAAPAVGTSQHDYDLYVQEGREEPVPLFGWPETWELDAVPILSRPVPPVVPDEATTALRRLGAGSSSARS